jgi:hypothetical protein
LGEAIEILFQAKHSEDPRQHPKTGREVAVLEAGESAARHIHTRRQVGKRHSTPETSEPQALAERLSATLGLREEGACRARHGR